MSASSANESSKSLSVTAIPCPVGILPLVHLKHFLFGNSLISLPFFDMGGILADDEKIERALLAEAMRIGRDLKVDKLELRHAGPVSWLASGDKHPPQSENELVVRTLSHKVRMILELPDTPEALMNSFKAKLRSQVKKPLKEGLTAKIGGKALLEDFYSVFSANMRDLGSPVHSRKLIENVLMEFSNEARIAVVYGKGARPMASSIVIGFKDTLENPWASALREYSALSPNMLLYWTMLEYACNQGFRYFDFGRSSPGEGTYFFKEQWGAKPMSLNWHIVSVDGRPLGSEDASDKARFGKAISYWQMLPIPVTKILGPKIRKYIGL
jgi:FemAB-related protein (PEP-CTERM system-associated)